MPFTASYAEVVPCARCASDNGLNFIGALRELKEALAKMDRPKIKSKQRC